MPYCGDYDPRKPRTQTARIKTMNTTVIKRTIIVAAVMVVALNVLLSASFDEAGGFGIIGKIRMSPSFADLRHLTANAGCDEGLEEIDKGLKDGCDVFGRPGLGYPPLIFHLARGSGINEEYTGGIGLTIGLSFIGILGGKYWTSFTRHGIPGMMIGIGALLGMPTILGLERMNIDIGIFVLFFLLSTGLEWSNKKMAITFPYSVVLASFVAFACMILSASKIYPGIGLLIWIASVGRKRVRSRCILYGLIGGTLVGTFIGMRWLLLGGKTPAPGVGVITHSIWLRLGDSPLSHTEAIVAVSVFLVTVISSVIYTKRSNSLVNSGSRGSCAGFFLSIFAQMSFISWLACYLTGTNYDYRMVLLIPAVTELCERSWKVLKISGKRKALLPKRCPECLAIAYFITVISPLAYFWLDSLQSRLYSYSFYISDIITSTKSLFFYVCRMSDLVMIPWMAGILMVYWSITSSANKTSINQAEAYHKHQ